MSTLWSVIGKTARGDVVNVTPRIDTVSYKDNSRTDISADVLACNITRDYKSGMTGSLRVTKKFRDPAFWIGHAVNPTLVVETPTGVSQVKLGLLAAKGVKEGYKDVSLSLMDIIGLHKQPQLHPFNTAPETEGDTLATVSPAAALTKLRELTSASQLVGLIDHRGFEPTTLLNPNPAISNTDMVDMRSYAAGSHLFCELELLLESIDWRPPWTTRRGLVTSEPYCSACDESVRSAARTLPSEVVYSQSLSVSTNLSAPNVLRVLDSNGDSEIRLLDSADPYSADSVGRSIPYLVRARNPASNIDQFWVSLRAPRRTVEFKCAAPGVFWHRDVFKLDVAGLDGAVCVVSRWALDVVSGVYSVSADLCGGVEQ